MRRRPPRSKLSDTLLPYTTLVRSAGALVPEAGEVDARLLPRAAAVEAHRHRAQLDAEDGADALEIVEHELEPVVVDAGLAIPGAGPFLRRVRKLVEAQAGGFDDFRHLDRLHRALRRARKRAV